MASDTANRQASERVVVVGSGRHFASGISHYTYLLSGALADEYKVGALVTRRLVPERFYPAKGAAPDILSSDLGGRHWCSSAVGDPTRRPMSQPT